MKRILLFPASTAQREAFIKAREMGFYIVTVDRNPQAECFALADESFCLDPGDAAALLDLVRAYHASKPLSGALLVGCDIPVSAAKAAAVLNTPCLSVQAAKLTVDKLGMKRVLRASGLPVPDFYRVENATQVQQLLAQHRCRMVIKPNDNSAARGVWQLEPGDDCDAAFRQAVANVKRNGVIFEKFEQGAQVSIEGIVFGGAVHVTGFADRNYAYLDRFFPHIIENGATMPTNLPDRARIEIERTFCAGVRALGIDNSVVKGDMVYTSEGAKIIEIAGRMSGGKFASLLAPQSTGIDLIAAALTLATGGMPAKESLRPSRTRGAAVRYFFPPPGRLSQLAGLDVARANPGVFELVMRFKPGDILPEITSHADRAGWVLCSAETRAQAVRTAEKAISDVSFQVEASAPVCS